MGEKVIFVLVVISEVAPTVIAMYVGSSLMDSSAVVFTRILMEWLFGAIRRYLNPSLRTKFWIGSGDPRGQLISGTAQNCVAGGLGPTTASTTVELEVACFAGDGNLLSAPAYTPMTRTIPIKK